MRDRGRLTISRGVVVADAVLTTSAALPAAWAMAQASLIVGVVRFPFRP